MVVQGESGSIRIRNAGVVGSSPTGGTIFAVPIFQRLHTSYAQKSRQFRGGITMPSDAEPDYRVESLEQAAALVQALRETEGENA